MFGNFTWLFNYIQPDVVNQNADVALDENEFDISVRTSLKAEHLSVEE